MILIGITVWLLSGCSDDDVTSPIANRTFRWSRQDSPLTITDTVMVQDSDVLVIEPGVTARFASGIPLIVKGTLHAVGTPSDSIVLTALDTYWGGLRFIGNGEASTMTYVAARHCREHVVRTTDASPVISHCRLTDCSTPAETGGQIVICDGASTPTIEYCLITGYSNFWACGIVCVPPANPRLLHSDIIGSRSAEDRCVCGGGFLKGNYLATVVWDGTQEVLVADLSLGDPVDQSGDGACTTTSADSLGLFSEVDGVTEPRAERNLAGW